MAEETLVVVSKTKEYAKKVGKDINVSSDFADALSKEVEGLIKKAIKRCNDNGRKTVQARDL